MHLRPSLGRGYLYHGSFDAFTMIVNILAYLFMYISLPVIIWMHNAMP